MTRAQTSYDAAARVTWTLADYRSVLVGRYVAVEAPATPEEAAYYATEWVGGSGLVTDVAQRGDAAEVLVDYGYGFLVEPRTIVTVCDVEHDHERDLCPVGVRGG